MRTDEASVVGRLRFNEQDARDGLNDLGGKTRRVFALWAIILVPVMVMTAYEGDWTNFVPASVGFAIFATVGPLVTRRSARDLARSLQEGEVEYQFDSDRVTIRAPGSVLTAEYRTMRSAREGKSCFLLFMNGTQVANLVPKRAFCPDDVARVRALITGKIAPRPKSRAAWKLLAIWAVLLVVFFVVWQLLNPR